MNRVKSLEEIMLLGNFCKYVMYHFSVPGATSLTLRNSNELLRFLFQGAFHKLT